MYGGVTALRRARSRAYSLGYGRTPTPNHFPKQVVCATGTHGPPPPHTHTIPRAPDAAPGPSTVIWLRKRRLAGHPKNVLKNAVARFDLPGKSGVVGLLYVRYPGSAMIP